MVTSTHFGAEVSIGYNEAGHQVDFCIIVFFVAEKEPHYYETVRDGQRKKIYENLLRSHQYNFRYQLVPDQGAKVFKTDMVVFGEVVSKIYTDVDTRVIQGCPEGEEDEEGNAPILKFCWKHK